MTPDSLAKKLLAGIAPTAEQWEIAAGVRHIADALACRDDRFPAEDIRKACKALNNSRQFEKTRELAQTWSDCCGFDPTIEKHHAQALISLSALAAAEKRLEDAITIASLDGSSPQAKTELPEYQGLQARVFKQKFVDTDDKGFLEAAFVRYLVQFRERQRTAYWHGINAVALLARSEREGHIMPGNVAAGAPTPRLLGGEVLKQLKATVVKPDDEPWRFAALSEVYLALGAYDFAELWLYRMMHHPRCTSFMLDSYERQLREIWQAGGTDGAPGCADKLATILAKHQMKASSRLSISSARIRELRKAGREELERNFSGSGSFTVDMIKRILSACASIGCVSSKDGARLGTGFLVDGSSVGASDQGGPVFVTNSHVLSDTVQGAVLLSNAMVSFELMPLADGKPGFYEVDQLLFTSPPGALGHCCGQTENLDVTVVSLKQLPSTILGLSVSQNLPLINGQTKAYVIGHPRGGGLQISVHDSVLLASDEQRRLLHYRTPTDPGSSGSPVFNEQWKVIALHRGGSDTTPRLKPASGVYEANEGVTLAAIRSGVGSAAGVHH